MMPGYGLVQRVRFVHSRLCVPQSALGAAQLFSSLVGACLMFHFCLPDEPVSLTLPDPCSDVPLLFAQVRTSE